MMRYYHLNIMLFNNQCQQGILSRRNAS